MIVVQDALIRLDGQHITGTHKVKNILIYYNFKI